MGWTEERVEILKKLWADGLSASQIAGRLGGITRNAVIGKVHRLGLAGRATTSRMRAPRIRQRVPHAPMRPTPAARVQYRTHGNAALKPVYAPVEQRTVALSVVPSARRSKFVFFRIFPSQDFSLMELDASEKSLS